MRVRWNHLVLHRASHPDRGVSLVKDTLVWNHRGVDHRADVHSSGTGKSQKMTLWEGWGGVERRAEIRAWLEVLFFFGGMLLIGMVIGFGVGFLVGRI